MALRSGYKGIKKLAAGLKWNRPGILAADDTALAKTFFPRSEQAVLGAKNLLPIKIEAVKSNNSSGTWNGNTYTLNGISYVFTVDNGYVTSISASGIASAASQVTLKHRNDGIDILTTGTAYTINGAKGNGNILDVLYTKDGAYAKYGTDAGDGFTFVAENGTLGIALTISNGTDLTTPIAIKPMLRLASDPDDTYAPYAMTNKELTDAVQGIINAASNAADFAAFKTAMGAITPVTRSLNREASPEDVTPEVIEEEKPVTKKTTKKITVKEGE